MINIKEQLNRVLEKQLENINVNLEKIADGEQKEYLKKTIQDLKAHKKINSMDFIENLSKLKGEKVDTEKLKELIK